MTPSSFQATTLDLLKNYWRIKAANALYRSSTDLTTHRLVYTNVPIVGLVVNQFASEAVGDAMTALDDFIRRRLPRDLFLAIIAEFEGRLTARLISLGQQPSGTLGNLQLSIQNQVTLHPEIISDLTEIRERRNAMIHHADMAHSRYVSASAAVLPRAAPFVNVTVAGDNVTPTEIYLAYAADVLVRYSNAIG